MGYIYKITNKVNNKSYIGQTTRDDVTIRWKEHIKNSKREERMVIYRAFRKHGVDNFLFSVLEECENNLLNEREIYWIDFYKTSNKLLGYNSTIGGNNASCHFYKKINQYTLDGVFVKTWNTQKDIERELGFDQASLSACLTHRYKTACGYQWRYIDDINSIEKEHYGRSKKVYMYDFNGNFIKEFLTIREAEKEINGNEKGTCILQCCKKKHKTAYGYQWSYDKVENIGQVKFLKSNQFLFKLTAI